jgi:hypothetical protein
MRGKMNNEYLAARDTLRWTHEKFANTLGIGERTPYRYANGMRIPAPQRRLLRLLVLLRLTLSKRKFEEIINALD